MQTRDFVAQLIQLAYPLILAAVAAYVAPAIRRHIHSKLASDAIDHVSWLAQTIVTALEQTVVADLKDPSKPGKWNDVAAKTVRETAVAELKRLGAHELAALGINDSDGLAAKLVEQAVHHMRSFGPSTTVNMGATLATKQETADAIRNAMESAR